MTIIVDNPRTGRVTIADVFDGECAVQGGADAVTLAFRWNRTGRRPETAAGSEAVLDGASFRVSSISRSALSAGFYVAVLTPAS